MKKKKITKQEDVKKEVKNLLDDLETKLEDFFTKKVWNLPTKAKDIIVKLLPYLSLLALVVMIPMVLSLIGLTMLSPFAYMGGFRAGIGYSVSIIFALITGVLAIVIIPGLFKKEKKAWKVMYWISLINAVSSLLKMDLGGLVIGTGLSWYVLFQIKEYYKK